MPSPRRTPAWSPLRMPRRPRYTATPAAAITAEVTSAISHCGAGMSARRRTGRLDEGLAPRKRGRCCIG